MDGHPDPRELDANWFLEEPYREALELANKATFSQAELDAYQKVIDEIQQVRVLVDAKLAEGIARGKRESVLDVLAARGIPVSDKVRVHIEACNDAAVLTRWIARATTAASAEEVIADASL